MGNVKPTITESACRSGYHKAGDSVLMQDLCPPSGRRGERTEREAQQRVACFLGKPAV